MHTPAGLRTARIIAGDVREGDLLRYDGEWYPVVGMATYGRMREFKLSAAAEPVCYAVAEPVLVRWPVPNTTMAMQSEVRR